MVSRLSTSIASTSQMVNPSHSGQHNALSESLGQRSENVKDWGAVGDGSTDDTAAIQAAITSVSTAGGGEVFFPEGTYVSTLLTMYSYVHLRGAGPIATILKLKNSTNTALIQGDDFVALSAGNTAAGIHDWSVKDMCLDGNLANNGTTGYGIRVYGYRFELSNLAIHSFKTNGIYSQWSSSSSVSGTHPGMEALLYGVRVYSCGGDGVYWNGPHDSSFISCFSFENSGKGFSIDTKGDSLLATNCHSWGNNQTYAWYLNASACQLVNCVGEGAATNQIWIGANDCGVIGGTYFAAGGGTTGVALGAAVGGLNIHTKLLNFTTSLSVGANDAGGSFFHLLVYQTSGAAISGTLGVTSQLILTVTGGGTGQESRFTDGIETFDGAGTLMFKVHDTGIIGFGDAQDTNLYRSAANTLMTDDHFYAVDGTQIPTKAGAPSDSDFVIDADGTLALDTTNHRLYVRSGGVWKYAALT